MRINRGYSFKLNGTEKSITFWDNGLFRIMPYLMEHCYQGKLIEDETQLNSKTRTIRTENIERFLLILSNLTKTNQVNIGIFS